MSRSDTIHIKGRRGYTACGIKLTFWGSKMLSPFGSITCPVCARGGR